MPLARRDDRWLPVIFTALIGMLIFAVNAVHTYNLTPEYTAQAVLEYAPPQTNSSSAGDIMDVGVLHESVYWENSQAIAESMALVVEVADRIKGQDRMEFLAPYSGLPRVEEILEKNREATLPEGTNIMHLNYTHANPNMAARVANCFAEELVNYQMKLSTDVSMRVMKDLRIRTELQREKVDQLKQLIAEADGGEIELLREDIEVQQALCQAMSERVQAEIIGPETVPVYIRIIDRATPPLVAAKPNIKQRLLYGAAPLPFLLVFGMLLSVRRG